MVKELASIEYTILKDKINSLRLRGNMESWNTLVSTVT